MHIKKNLLLSILMLGFSVAHAQLIEKNAKVDSAQSKSVRSPDSALVRHIKYNINAAYKITLFAKPLNYFEIYDPSKKDDLFYANLGNNGSASSLLFYKPYLGSNFRYRNDVFAPYRLNSDNIKFYISKKTFSHLYYIMGWNNNQRLEVDLSQKIGNGLNFGLNARVSNEPGMYPKQRTAFSGGNFYALFFHPSKRYGAIANFIFDKMNINESGGITKPNFFMENKEKNRKTFQVNLSDATNIDKFKEITVQHYFNILRQKKLKDTVPKAQTTLPKRTFDAGRLVHTFRFSRAGSSYEDKAPADIVYPGFNTKTGKLYDTLSIRNIENNFVYSNETPDTSALAFPLQYSFGVKLENTTVYSNNNVLKNNQAVSFGSLKGIIAGKTYFVASGYFITGGYRAADYKMEGNFYQFFGGKRNKAYANFTQAVLKPDYLFSKYATKNISWDNGLDKTILMKVLVGLEIKNLNFNAAYSIVQNYTYFNRKFHVTQHTKPLSVFEATLIKTMELNHWRIDAVARGQYITPDTVIRVPLLMGKLSICYDNRFFDKALHAQIGISGTYHSLWKQDAYLPALRAFYQQNYYTAGNYPYLDAFVNLNVKRARLFFKYEHFNALFFPKEYMMVPYYPQPDAMFKFGVSWLFFD